MTTFSIINPYTLNVTQTMPYDTLDISHDKLSQLHHAFNAWSKDHSIHVAPWLTALANQLHTQRDIIATTISEDMGKPISDAQREVQKCIDAGHYFSDHASRFLTQMTHEKGHRKPLGVILGIMPWNFPLWQLIRFMVPAILVGNTALIKPAPNTYRVAQLLYECQPSSHRIFDITIPNHAHTSELISHPQIQGVSFTGSVPVGRHVGALAGQQLKPCVLELGGSDPYIIFNDAPLDAAIDSAVQSRFSNAGQTCISAKRFLFEASIFDTAIARFQETVKANIIAGPPLHPNTTIGPMARHDLKDALLRQLADANLPSSAIIYTHHTANSAGHYVPPMIIDGRGLSPNNPLNASELFGPIAICDSFRTTDDAIQKANASIYGLGASIWTKNQTIANDCIDRIECGSLAINQPVHSAFDTPFGGWKASGLGVELGIEGVLSFTKFKAIQSKTTA
jgi:succinate-semialdehyde dehydrogenase/glutarate-semialdehyde dehydrogenase